MQNISVKAWTPDYIRGEGAFAVMPTTSFVLQSSAIIIAPPESFLHTPISLRVRPNLRPFVQIAVQDNFELYVHERNDFACNSLTKSICSEDHKPSRYLTLSLIGRNPTESELPRW